MTGKIQFTKRDIEALPAAPAGKRQFYSDPRTPGLRIMVTAKGNKSWILKRRIEGRPQTVTLGRFPDMAVSVARNKAEQTIGEIASGKNPPSGEAQSTGAAGDPSGSV